MTPYKECPFCERTIEIEPDDEGPLEQHIRRMHADESETADESGSSTRFE